MKHESHRYWVARRDHLLGQFPSRKVRRGLAKCNRVLHNRFDHFGEKADQARSGRKPNARVAAGGG